MHTTASKAEYHIIFKFGIEKRQIAPIAPFK